MKTLMKVSASFIETLYNCTEENAFSRSFLGFREFRLIK